MEIDVIDMRDQDAGRLRRRWLTGFGARSARVEIQHLAGSAARVAAEVARLASPGQLQILRIWSDVPPGLELFGDRATAAAGLVSLSQQLGLLHALFGPRAHAELRGCGLGLRAPAREFVQSLARVWEVPVQAGRVLKTTGEWCGPVVQAMPTGAIVLTTGARVWGPFQERAS